MSGSVDSAVENEALLRVSSSSSPGSLASAISHAVYDGKRVVLRAVGAGAVNQAVKGVAIAQSYVGMRGLVLYIRPGFTTVTIKGEDVTAVVFRVEAR